MAIQADEKKLKNYFNKLYKETAEPWYSSKRYSEIERFERSESLLKKHIQNPQKVLDLGCSTGIFSATVAGFSKEIFAVDISEKVIKRAKEKWGEKNNLSFLIGSLPCLGFKEDKFDLVMALEIINYLTEEDRNMALSEISRVLKKEGIFIVSAVIEDKPYFQIEEFRELIGNYFIVLECNLSYRKIYKKIETLFFMRIVGIMNSVKTVCGSPALKKVLDIFEKIILYPLTIKTFLRVTDFFTRMLYREKGVTRCIIVAKSKKD